MRLFTLTLLLAAWFTAFEPSPSSGDEITLLTYNLHTEKRLIEPMIDVIRAADADIVALQETHYETATAFNTLLADEYPYQTTIGTRNTYSQMLLSRYPLQTVEVWPPHEAQLLRAEINVNGVPVVVYNLHPTSPGNTGMDTTIRSGEISLMLESAADETAPVILMGDFNMEEWSEDYQRISASYTDAFRQLHPLPANPGFTYPDYSYPQSRRYPRFPAFTPLLLRLDYIFHSADFTPLHAEVWPDSGGSDHRPVYARLRLITSEE